MERTKRVTEPDTFTWASYRQKLHREPAVARARKELADTYRQMRRENPAAARLVKRAYDKTYAAVAKAVFSSPGANSLITLLGDEL